MPTFYNKTKYIKNLRSFPQPPEDLMESEGQQQAQGIYKHALDEQGTAIEAAHQQLGQPLAQVDL